MSRHAPQDSARPAGDREYFWFALLLLAVLTTSVNQPTSLRNSAATVDAPAAQP